MKMVLCNKYDIYCRRLWEITRMIQYSMDSRVAIIDDIYMRRVLSFS